MTIRDEVDTFLREQLERRLAQCTEPQRELFSKVYPGHISNEKLIPAIDLCDRTLAKNAKLKDAP